MREYTEILKEFRSITDDPKRQFEKLLADGKKVVGCMTYFCPEELIYAAGMTPFGIWGADIEVSESKRWFPAFVCSILHTALELGIKGDFNGMAAVMVPKLCDSLKSMGANWECAVPGIPVINVAHAQNRALDAGIEFTASQYRAVSAELARHGGNGVTDNDVINAVKLLNQRREALRNFTRLAAKHPEAVSPRERRDVIKSSYFMEAGPYVLKLLELNEILGALPDAEWSGPRVVTTGILADAPELLRILEDNNISIAGDQVLHESVSFTESVQITDDPYIGLAMRMAAVTGTSVLYDPGKIRAKELLRLAQNVSADGVIYVLTKFCDPEEYDYVPVKKLLDENRVPCLLVEADRQTKSYEQARTAIEAFAGMLKPRR